MSQPAKLDPELAEALAAMELPAGGMFDLSDIEGTRERYRERVEKERMEQLADPRVSIETTEIEREDGPAVSLRLFQPRDAQGDLPAILWMHGGGQVFGYAADEDQFLSRLARKTGCLVLSVDYRLAPETRAPGAAEDGFAAYRWLLGAAGRLGVDAGRIGLGGTSAGGGLAANISLMIRDRGLPLPRFLSMAYPMLDDRNNTGSSRDLPPLGIWDRDDNVGAWQAALGDRAGSDDLPRYTAAARADSLADLPNAFIATGELDIFRDECLAFAQRLIESGVPTELHVYQGAFHGWDRFAPESEMTTAFLSTWFAFINRHLQSDRLK